MLAASGKSGSAATGRPRCIVGLDLRRPSRVVAVAVDGKAQLRAWASIHGEDDPVALTRIALETLSVRPKEVRVLIGSERVRVGVCEGAGAPGAAEISEALVAEGHEPILKAAVASLSADSGAWLVAACDEEKARSLVDGLAELLVLEPTLAVDQLLILEQLQPGTAAIEITGDELLIVARPAGAAPLTRSLPASPDAEQTRSEVLRTLVKIGGARSIRLLGGRRTQLREMLDQQEFDLDQEALPAYGGEPIPADLELTWRLATAISPAGLSSPELAKRRQSMQWARRAAVLSVAVIILSVILVAFGISAALRIRAVQSADSAELAAFQSQIQQLREAGALAQEVERLRAQLGPLSLPWPRLAGPIDELVRRSPPGMGWERLAIVEGELELEVSSAGVSPLVDLELARSALEGTPGFSNASWDEAVPDPTGPGLRQTLRATLVSAPGSTREAR